MNKQFKEQQITRKTSALFIRPRVKDFQLFRADFRQTTQMSQQVSKTIVHNESKERIHHPKSTARLHCGVIHKNNCLRSKLH